jgi:hypothetical protein
MSTASWDAEACQDISGSAMNGFDQKTLPCADVELPPAVLQVFTSLSEPERTSQVASETGTLIFRVPKLDGRRLITAIANIYVRP